MATIEIHRPMDYLGICRKLKVWIDGVHIGSIRTEETEIFEVTDAIHTVQVSMNWCKSVLYEAEMSNGKATKLLQGQNIFCRLPAFLVSFDHHRFSL